MVSNVPSSGVHLLGVRPKLILFETAPSKSPAFLVSRGSTPSSVITSKDSPSTFLKAGSTGSSYISSALIGPTHHTGEPGSYYVVNIGSETTQEDFRRVFSVTVNGIITDTISEITLAPSRLHESQQIATVKFKVTPRCLTDIGSSAFTDLQIGQFWPKFDMMARDDDGHTALSRGAINANLDLVLMLAHFGDVDINSKDNNGRTPLHLACLGKCVTVVQFLLQVPGLEVSLRSNEGETAYDLARQNKDHTIGLIFMINVLELDQHNPDEALLRILTMSSEPYHPDAPPHNPVDLFAACTKGNEKLVDALIYAGVDVNAVDDHQSTSLIEAAKHGHATVVSTLITANANINAIDSGQVTALDFAAMEGYPEVARTLLRTPGIDINRPDAGGFTALHYACRGQTAGGEVVGRDWGEVVKMLVEKEGLNLDARTGEGKTASQIAVDGGHPELASSLPHTG